MKNTCNLKFSEKPIKNTFNLKFSKTYEKYIQPKDFWKLMKITSNLKFSCYRKQREGSRANRDDQHCENADWLQQGLKNVPSITSKVPPNQCDLELFQLSTHYWKSTFWSVETRSCLSWALRTCTSCTWRCTRTSRRRWTTSWGGELSSMETSE